MISHWLIYISVFNGEYWSTINDNEYLFDISYALPPVVLPNVPPIFIVEDYLLVTIDP